MDSNSLPKSPDSLIQAFFSFCFQEKESSVIKPNATCTSIEKLVGNSFARQVRKHGDFSVYFATVFVLYMSLIKHADLLL